MPSAVVHVMAITKDAASEKIIIAADTIHDARALLRMTAMQCDDDERANRLWAASRRAMRLVSDLQRLAEEN